MRSAMARESEQAVIDVQRIHVDGFDRGRPRRHRVKIANSQIAERISFETKIDLQVLFASVPERNLADDRQQNWPMKNDQEPHAYGEANNHVAPKVPVSLRL